ncbi:MAG TPA: UDP-4-amino-4,6-dideoxy-N-acetyl-beta-L-altrosamine transaminase, partial [Deltaproteobacteria bacterium]|nr:UDP-4-amino-4,6-dideoxy-N-acetyl-beta-L-altrosamine transaminase [Deltaproteobacteria bacterium]
YGHPCDMEPILDIAKNYRLAVIEDAAHALPAHYKGRIIGSLPSDYSQPHFTCFSFYATKNMTTSEGGMLTGASKHIENAGIWSLHGLSRDAWKRYGKEGSWAYDVVYPGYKYNMTDIQASLGLWQLKKLAEFQKRRQEIALMYNEVFEGREELQLPVVKSGVEPSWHLYVLRLNFDCLRITRDTFIEELKALNIGTSVHFIPIHLHSYYKNKYGYKEVDFPVAYENYLRMLSLPLYPRMTDEDVDSVIEAVINVLRKYKR